MNSFHSTYILKFKKLIRLSFKCNIRKFYKNYVKTNNEINKRKFFNLLH